MTSPKIWDSLRQLADEGHRDSDRATRAEAALEACETELALVHLDEKKKTTALREIMYRMEEDPAYSDSYRLAREALGLS